MLSRSHHCWCFSLFLTYYGSFAQPLFISPPSWHHTILQAGGVGTHTELSRQVAVEAAGCAWRGQAGWLAGRSWLMCSVPPQWLRHLGSVSAGGGPGWVRDKRCDQGGEGKEQIMTFDFANGPCEAGAWIQFKSYGSKNNHATHTYMPRFSENLKKVLSSLCHGLLLHASINEKSKKRFLMFVSRVVYILPLETITGLSSSHVTEIRLKSVAVGDAWDVPAKTLGLWQADFFFF